MNRKGKRKMLSMSRAESIKRTGSMDLESHGKGPPVPRRRRKRSLWRFPLSVGISAFLIFLFFLILGSRRQSSSAIGFFGSTPPPPRKVNQGQPTLFTFEVMAEFPHDDAAFTQGLEYDERCQPHGPCKPIFWESTGLNGQSSVREVELTTGKVLRSKSLPKSDFGEGMTKLGKSLYQITWQTNKGWKYSVDNFDDATEIRTPLSDGWGATSNDTHLILSDSSPILSFVDPHTMELVRQVEVTDGLISEDVPRTVKWLNELEWVDGLIYANVYTTECIAQIDPNTGSVVGWMVLKGLGQRMMASIPEAQRRANWYPDVLNGIAWDGKGMRLFVTGKLWPKVYQIEARPMYVDSKATDVVAILDEVRSSCIVDPDKGLGR